jgi:signal transduction histidine kinase
MLGRFPGRRSTSSPLATAAFLVHTIQARPASSGVGEVCTVKLVVPPRIVLLLSAAAVANVAGAVLSSRILEARREDTAVVAASWRALAATQRVMSLLIRTEAAWRDHAASGHPEAWARYTEARGEIQVAIERHLEALPYHRDCRDAWSATAALVTDALTALDWHERPPPLLGAAAGLVDLGEDALRLAMRRAEMGLERVMAMERVELSRAEVAQARSTSLANVVIVSAYAALLLLVGVAAYAVRGHLKQRERREAEQEHTLELQQRLIGIVGHDLRTPLNAIAGSAKLLARAPDLPSSRTRAAQRIVSSAGRMSRMVRDLLDFTRARGGGGLAVAPEPAHLGEISRRVIQEVRAARPGCDIRVVEEGDLAGEWDPARLEQVLSNLVGNACHYGTPGAPVLVRAMGTASSVTVEVHNEGTPIPDEVLPRIFDPFERGQHDSRDANGNVGLGLFIVRTLVDAHGGRIDVETGDGGTTFSVHLPRSTHASAGLGPSASSPS